MREKSFTMDATAGEGTVSLSICVISKNGKCEKKFKDLKAQLALAKAKAKPFGACDYSGSTW
jgi:hypothetical protein